MIGSMNEKTSLPVPASEAKPLVDNLFQRKEQRNRESGRTDFENYLKAATTDKSKPFRETDPKFSDRQTTIRRDEPNDDQRMDSPHQVVKEDRNSQTDKIQKNTDDKGEVSAQKPEQTAASVMDSETSESQTELAEVQGLSLNPVVQVAVNDAIQPADALTGVQSMDASTAEDVIQFQMVPMEELMNGQTAEHGADDQNVITRQTATVQIPVDGLTDSTQGANSAAGQTASTFERGLTEAMEALLGSETGLKDKGLRETGNQSQTKVTVTNLNDPKPTVLNSTVLEVFQDKVTAQAAIQNLSQSKEDLRQSLQNSAMGRTVASAEGNKPVNLAVLQAQLAVGDGLDKTNNTMAMPLQHQQLQGAQFQETTQAAAHTAGKDQLFTQIMEHAKLMLSGNQSELEMSLKPDHLGKLQLKVMVENQVVTARFVAESQQVKQIIETNLNQLRDQLRESGLHVDYLSVSVGNGGREQFFNQTAGNQSQFGPGGNSHSTTDDMNEVSATGEAVTSLQETVIDLIA